MDLNHQLSRCKRAALPFELDALFKILSCLKMVKTNELNRI